MKRLLIIIPFCFLALSSRCQTSQTPPNTGYPIGVLMKVQDIASVINLTTDRQTAFANFFQKESDALSQAVSNNATGKQLNDLKSQLTQEFRALLTADELAAYSQKKPGSRYALPVLSDYKKP